MEKIKNFFKNIFTRKWKNTLTSNPNKVLFKPKKSVFKRKNRFNIKIDFNKYTKFFKKNYIPYYYIFWVFSILWILFVILGPIFKIENIDIIRKDSLSDINIAYKSIDYLRWTSTFNVEKSEVLESLKSYQENIKSVDLKIKFPKTINLQIESYKEKFNVSINGKNYILLENWSLIPTINQNKELKNLEIIKNIEKTKILDYKVIFDMKQISKIEKIEKKVLENISYIEISNLKYYEKERELHIILNNITRLIFSLDESIDIDEQIKNLAVFNKDNSPIANNDKIYIDLRVKWKIFFCSLENEKRCKANLEYIYSQL